MRVIERAIYGHVQFDLAIAVLQYRDGQAHRELGGVRALNFFTQQELVEHDEIL